MRDAKASSGRVLVFRAGSRLCGQRLTSTALCIELPVAACSRLRIPQKFGTDCSKKDLPGTAETESCSQVQSGTHRSIRCLSRNKSRLYLSHLIFSNRLVETFPLVLPLQPQFCAGARAYRSHVFFSLGGTVGQPQILFDAAVSARRHFLYLLSIRCFTRKHDF